MNRAARAPKAPKVHEGLGGPWEEWDDDGRAALDECVLAEIELFAAYPENPKSIDEPRTLDDLVLVLGAYCSTYRKNERERGRVTVWLDRDDPDSRAEVTTSLARLTAAGYVEEVSEGHYGITAEGRRHL